MLHLAIHTASTVHRFGRGIAALDHDVIPARESGRFGLHAETGGVGVWAGFNPASRKAIPTHRVYCCSGALRALANLGVCGPACLYGKTWLPSAMFQACQTLIDTPSFLDIFFHLIGNLVQFAEPYIRTAFILGKCCARAPDLATLSRLEKKHAVDRLLSPLKCLRG